MLNTIIPITFQEFPSLVLKRKSSSNRFLAKKCIFIIFLIKWEKWRPLCRRKCETPSRQDVWPTYRASLIKRKSHLIDIRKTRLKSSTRHRSAKFKIQNSLPKKNTGNANENSWRSFSFLPRELVRPSSDYTMVDRTTQCFNRTATLRTLQRGLVGQDVSTPRCHTPLIHHPDLFRHLYNCKEGDER